MRTKTRLFKMPILKQTQIGGLVVTAQHSFKRPVPQLLAVTIAAIIANAEQIKSPIISRTNLRPLGKMEKVQRRNRTP